MKINYLSSFSENTITKILYFANKENDPIRDERVEVFPKPDLSRSNPKLHFRNSAQDPGNFQLALTPPNPELHF